MRIMAVIAGILFSLGIFAASANPTTEVKSAFIEGKDYTLLAEPVRPVDPSKIEVVEVFAYTCRYCMKFEPLIEAWIKKQQPDVSLVQIHTMWSPQMEPYQRGFYTAVALKIKDKVQMAAFDAVHSQQKELNDAQAWANFLSAYGVDKQAVLSTYDSFGVTSQIKQADARIRGYKITGTPELIVDGKYRINSTMAGGHDGMLKVAQFIVDKIRAERVKSL